MKVTDYIINDRAFSAWHDTEGARATVSRDAITGVIIRGSTLTVCFLGGQSITLHFAAAQVAKDAEEALSNVLLWNRPEGE